MALNSSIMVLGLLDIQVKAIVVFSLCMFIVQRLKPKGIFVLVEEVLNFRQFAISER